MEYYRATNKDPRQEREGVGAVFGFLKNVCMLNATALTDWHICLLRSAQG